MFQRATRRGCLAPLLRDGRRSAGRCRILVALAFACTFATSSSVCAQVLNLSANAIVTVPAILGPAVVTVPVQVLGSPVNVNLNISPNDRGINLLPLDASLRVTIAGQTIPLTIQPGAIPVIGQSPVVNVPITISLPQNLVTNALNELSATIIARRNDALLGLDIGLDRQVGILVGPGGDDNGAWSSPMGVGAMRLGSSPLDSRGDGFARRGDGETLNGDAISFATSLQKMRLANTEYAVPSNLGATSRPTPPPARSPFDIWAEGSFAWFNDGGGAMERHGYWGVLYLGADYRVSRDLLIGTLVQFDGSSQDFDAFAGVVRSNGWMVGPYATMRLTPNLFLQTRAAWGRSSLELGLGTDPADEIDAERWLLRGTLLGHWRSGPWQLRPRVSIGYIEERQEAYFSSIGVPVPGQTLSLGQIKGGPEIAYRTVLRDGTAIEPKVLLEGVWNFLREGGAATPDDIAFGEKLRGRVEAGIDVLLRSGIAMSAAVSYDGIGTGDFQAVVGKLRAKAPLN